MTPDNLPARPRTGLVAVNLTDPLADLDSALRLSDVLARSDLVPRALVGKPANVFHVLMTGKALGLHWTESLRVIYSPGQGQIGLRGSFLLSRLRQMGHRYSFTEGEDSCTFTLIRGDTNEKFVSTFTIEDAIRGGLATRNQAGEIIAKSREGKPLPWMQWTDRMLRWRSVADGTSVGAPEVALGFEIEGSDLAAEPQPEIVLTPQSPAPPGPDAGQAAPNVTQAEQAEQVAELDRQMRTDMPGEPDGPPLGESEMGGIPHMGGNPADAPGVDTEAGPPAGRRALERELTAQFRDMGWDPAKFRADMLRACSMFAGRRVTSVRDLNTQEMAALSAALRRLAGKHPEASQPVALADWTEEMREKFAETDPDGYATYEEGK